MRCSPAACPVTRCTSAPDGRWLTVGALEPPFWRELCAVIGARTLSGAAVRSAARSMLAELFRRGRATNGSRCSTGTTRASDRSTRLAEAIADPQLRSSRDGGREDGRRARHPSSCGTPLKFRHHPASLRTPAREGLGDDQRNGCATGVRHLSHARSPIRSRQVAPGPLRGLQQRLVEREQGLQALDLVLVEGAQHPPCRRRRGRGPRRSAWRSSGRSRGRTARPGLDAASRRARTGPARGRHRRHPVRGRSSSTRPRR